MQFLVQIPQNLFKHISNSPVSSCPTPEHNKTHVQNTFIPRSTLKISTLEKQHNELLHFTCSPPPPRSSVLLQRQWRSAYESRVEAGGASVPQVLALAPRLLPLSCGVLRSVFPRVTQAAAENMRGRRSRELHISAFFFFFFLHKERCFFVS